MWIFWIPIDVCCVSGPDVQLAKLVVRNVLPCLSNWSLPPSLPSLLPLNKKYFFSSQFNPKLTFSLDPSYQRGRVYKSEICLSVCLFVSHHFTSNFKILNIDPFYIIPGSRQTSQIIYIWLCIAQWAGDDVICHLVISMTHVHGHGGRGHGGHGHYGHSGFFFRR